MNYDAKYFIEKFQMQLHPEGGWFKETYRSDEIILKDHLPNRYSDARLNDEVGQGRSFSTAIYFLLEGNQFSSFHRIKSDEMWHFYAGGPLNVHVINQQGELTIIKIGSNLKNGETFQAFVKAGCWFASKPAEPNSFSLVGCTVAPGFDFEDFELAKADVLVAEYPEHEQTIRRLCR